jgi:hypothetical protein
MIDCMVCMGLFAFEPGASYRARVAKKPPRAWGIAPGADARTE